MPGPASLPIISDADKGNLIARHIRQLAAAGGVVHILEAGCGQQWDVELGGVDYTLTGVDLDPAALEMRLRIVGDVVLAVEGDLRTVELRNGHYDVIYNAFVLEHVRGAEQVLDNFAKWAKPHGIIVIRIPDPTSVNGFLARLTPHWFHVFFYRAILGVKNAGKTGHAPYPAHYDPVVSRRGMHEYCRRTGLAILAECGEEETWFRRGHGPLRTLIYALRQALHFASLGALSVRHTNLLYILQKPQARQAA